MASDTPPAHRQLVVYEVFVRNHGPHGTFADVEADLPRIRAMGVDIVWLMPIHPIGVEGRKGSLGSPYAIRDYRAVNPEYGTRDDFVRLVGRAHALGLRVMIDVVYNHTSPDARLAAEHPEHYHRDADGRLATTVPDWSDVIDLRHGDPALTEELIATLEDWVRLGVDGFRCDVASIVPPAFWSEARRRVAEVRPGVVWLAESVHADWVAERRARGLAAVSDSELHAAAFDLTYDYDIWPLFVGAVRGELPVARYLEAVRYQDSIYPANFVKLRCVENHDNVRIMALAPTPARALAWTAFQAFNAGAFLVYAGQEASAAMTPSLFDRDPVRWDGERVDGFIARLAALKKAPALATGRLRFLEAEPAIQAAWEHPGEALYGVFNVTGSSGDVAVQLADGSYWDLLTDRTVPVAGGRLTLPADAVILRAGVLSGLRRLEAPLLDHDRPRA